MHQLKDAGCQHELENKKGDFQARNIRDKGPYIMMTRLILQEDLTVPYHACVCLTTEQPGANDERRAEKQINPFLQLETTTIIYHKWTTPSPYPAGRNQ